MKLYTKNEIILCTYAALYGEADFGGIEKIESLENRSTKSIKMKIQNIVAILDEDGIERYSNVSPLSGRPTGQKGRRTNWNWVEPLTTDAKIKLLIKCQNILAAN